MEKWRDLIQSSDAENNELMRFLLLLAWSLTGSGIVYARRSTKFKWLYLGAICGPFAYLVFEPKRTRGPRRTGKNDPSANLTLTELDVRRLMSGQALWYHDLDEAWRRLLASAKWFETPSGLKRLKLQGLNRDDYYALHRMCYCAEQAASTEGQGDRIGAWAERLEKKLLKRVGGGKS